VLEEWPDAPKQSTTAFTADIPSIRTGSILAMKTNMSSINGMGRVGPETFDTFEILAVETDRINKTVHADKLPGAKKQRLTSYDEHIPEEHKSGSCGVRNETTVGSAGSRAASTDTIIALVLMLGAWERLRVIPNPGVDKFRPVGKL
jgi:hypothetical protein